MKPATAAGSSDATATSDARTAPATPLPGGGRGKTDPTAYIPKPVSRLGGLLSSSAVLLGYVVIFAFFAIDKPHTFLTAASIENMLDQAVVPALLVCGMTLVLTVGELDLAFANVVGAAAAIVIVLMARHGVEMLLSSLIVLVLGAAVGAVIGLFVTVGKASSIIVTLAFSSVLMGVEIAVGNNTNIYTGVPASFGRLTSEKFLGLHAPVWFAAVVMLLFAVLLQKTRFGRQAQAIGSNPTAAYLAGVKVARVKTMCFVLLSVLSAAGAIILTSRASSYYPGSEGNLLLNTFAAVFLGAVAGGRGRFGIAGSALGVAWIVTLQTGLVQINAASWLSNLLQGVLLAVVVLFGARRWKEA